MEYRTIQYAVDDAVATITLHRPDKMNAFTSRMCHELLDALDQVDGDGPKQFLVRQMEMYRNLPPSNWDGVFSLSGK